MGLMRKTATLLLLAALSASESVLGFDAMDYSAVFFIVHELLSITEKAAALGVPVPVRVRRVLMVLREEYNEQQDRAEDQSNTQNSR
jgi:phage-related holin